MTYPTAKTDRAAKREEIRNRHIASAEIKALILNRSLKCSGSGFIADPRHAGMPEGCRYAATDCLCECHDEAKP